MVGPSKKKALTFSFSSIPTPNPYQQHEVRRPAQKTGQKSSDTGPVKDETRTSHDDIQTAKDQVEQSVMVPGDESPHPKAPRYTYRDHKGILREIWQPGDSDGQRDGEFPDNNICKSRWRFFQSNVGEIKHSTWPPKYVILDDKAAYAVSLSGEYNQKERRQYWPFDFNYHGNVRIGRPNRGRAAIVGEGEGDRTDLGNNQGEQIVGWSVSGERSKTERRYHFTGERTGWTEITFRPYAASKKSDRVDVSEDKTPDGANKRKAESQLLSSRPVVNPRHKRQKVGPYLRSTPSPEWPVRDKSRRAYTSKTAYRAFDEEDEDEDGDDMLDQSARTPWNNAGTKTTYAGMPKINASLFPDRVGGRIVQSRIQTGAQSSHVGASDGRALWQSVKDMESELIQSRATLSSRDQQIQDLTKNLEAREKSTSDAHEWVRSRDAEIEKLKAELRGLRNV